MTKERRGRNGCVMLFGSLALGVAGFAGGYIARDRQLPPSLPCITVNGEPYQGACKEASSEQETGLSGAQPVGPGLQSAVEPEPKRPDFLGEMRNERDQALEEKFVAIEERNQAWEHAHSEAARADQLQMELDAIRAELESISSLPCVEEPPAIPEECLGPNGEPLFGCVTPTPEATSPWEQFLSFAAHKSFPRS